jgi:UDP-N-acetylmuramoyl-L-alanyl-D-glutamate--2,6-diaminopimelate ligase
VANDPRQFVNDALQRGAAACLIEQTGRESLVEDHQAVAYIAGLQSAAGVIAAEFFNHPSQRLAVLAVTGTNGKTSTAWWLAGALAAVREPAPVECAVVGTLGVGRPPDLIGTGMTTPDPVLLQRVLRQFVDAGLAACAVEASSIGIVEQRLVGTQVRVAIFTNFTQDHLDYHGDMDNYWLAKRQLFDRPELRCAVINVDDSRGRLLADELLASGMDIWTTSCLASARLRAGAIGYSAAGLVFDVTEGAETLQLKTQLIGQYNVSNLLGVIATLRSLGISLQQAVSACATLQPVPGRMECLGGIDEPLVVVDYAHTPDALEQALAALRGLADQRAGRLWCVFGCGGDRDPTKRPLMGAIAKRRADRVVITSDNPRSERPQAIIDQIVAGLNAGAAVHAQSDRALAIAQTIAQATASDVILVAGKGHEATQEILGVRWPFSDHDHCAQALQAWRSIPVGAA